MTTIDLRNQIIQKLKEINDLSFLEAVKTIIDSKVDNEVFFINEKLQQNLLERKEKIRKGEFIENENLFKEADEWLKGK